jgi:hypothetical protein
LPKNEMLDTLKRALGLQERPVSFLRFQDSSGNFELYYPMGWRFDHDIMIEDARYTISFSSPDSCSTFTVAVDANLPEKFNFARYAKKELESPTSGIYTTAKRGKFHGMPAYERQYGYTSGGRRYAGGGVMFCTGNVVFSLSWGAPIARDGKRDAIFKHMMESFMVLEGFVMTPRKGSLRTSG